MDFDRLFVAPFFPCADLAAQPIGVVQAAIEAVPMQNAAFDFRHVEPAGVLGCVMELQAVQQPSRFIRRKRLVQSSPRMGVEVIEHQTNACGLRRMHVYQCTDAFGPVPFGPARRHPSMTPSSLRFATHTLIAHPFALIGIVLALDTTSVKRQGSVDLAKQLFAVFFHTDDGMASSVWPLVDPQDVLHVRHPFGIGCGRNAPRLHLPQLEIVFCNAWRTVSREARATYPSSTIRSASTRTVQRPRPRGGSPQARAITCGAPSPLMVTLSGRLEGRRGLRAVSKLSSTQCCRTRWRVERLAPNASAMASSAYLMPSGLASACSKLRPGSSLRAAPLPDETIFRSKHRSSSVRVTRNLTMGDLLLCKPQSVARRRIDLDQHVNRRLPNY